jgi:predicted naringenin-chalcone synthase
VTLSAEAIERALTPLGLVPEDVTSLIVNTCTGYTCPGIATYLVEKCGFLPTVKTYDLVGTGCAGAVPNLQLAQRIIQADPDEIVLCVSVEICSATFEMGNSMSLIVSNAIFGDGAAAVVLWGKKSGLQLKDTASYCDPAFRNDVRYIHKKGRLHNQLSPQLPDIIGTLVPKVVADLLSSRGLLSQEVKHWAIHPGGDKMISQIQDKLSLSEEQMAPTRSVLRDYGNMSSPTVLFELADIMGNGIEKDDWCLAVAYGAGLAIHAYLLQQY